MRACMMAAFLIAGALAMPGEADDKKEEVVSFRRWVPAQKEFVKAVPDLKAEYREVKDRKTWRMADTGGGEPSVGSEIITKDGVVWVVKKVASSSAPWIFDCEKQDPPKKPD